MQTSNRPLIGVTADSQTQGLHRVNQSGEKYISSVVSAADALPFIIPSLPDTLPLREVLQNLDGILVTGAYANIEPWRYQQELLNPDEELDPVRDDTTLALIPLAVEMGVPLLGICRGFQEMNVAFGGTLHQRLHEVDGFIEHREDKSEPLDVQYGNSHTIIIEPGGIMEQIAGTGEQHVNSVHMQGIKELAEPLSVEAKAPDGLVEAVSVRDSKAFALAVQWHPEFGVTDNAFYSAIYQAFAQACRERQKTRINKQ